MITGRLAKLVLKLRFLMFLTSNRESEKLLLNFEIVGVFNTSKELFTKYCHQRTINSRRRKTRKKTERYERIGKEKKRCRRTSTSVGTGRRAQKVAQEICAGDPFLCRYSRRQCSTALRSVVDVNNACNNAWKFGALVATRI